MNAADEREELLIEAWLALEFGHDPPCLCVPQTSSDHGAWCPLAPYEIDEVVQ